MLEKLIKERFPGSNNYWTGVTPKLQIEET
jgi:hypothetical protein